MIYLQGINADPTTWTVFDGNRPALVVEAFKTRKDARSWVLRELRDRAKKINRVRDAWLRGKSST